MWHLVIKICFYPPLKFFSVIVYLSYKSTTAYNWLGYTYLIARSYLHDVGQGIKAVHEQEESRMERSNEKQRGIRIFASSICRFFLISLVEAIQPIPWWSILFLHCELYHHLLRLPLPDNSLIMMLTVPPLMQRIFWRPFFPRCHPFPLPCMLDKNLIWSCISCSLCFSLVVSESINFSRRDGNMTRKPRES